MYCQFLLSKSLYYYGQVKSLIFDVLLCDFYCVVCVIIIVLYMMCCAVMYCAVGIVQCGGRVIRCMIELGVVDGWFV